MSYSVLILVQIRFRFCYFLHAHSKITLHHKMLVSYSDEEIPTLRYEKRQIQTGITTQKSYDDNTYIDWSKESQLRNQTSEFQTKKWITVIVLSVLIGYMTMFIDLSSVWLNDFKKGLCFSKIEEWSLLNPYSTCPVDDWMDWSEIFFNSNGIWTKTFVNFPIYLGFAILFILVVAYITIYKEPLIKQSGIPEIKLIISGFNLKIDRYLGLTTLVYKSFGLILVVSSGLWLGKEGPLVHVSCCIMNIIYSLILGNSNESIKRELYSAATATGISVAFNAPIGGVLFVLEEMPSFFLPTKIMWNSFIAATVAVITLSGFKAFTEGESFSDQDMFSVNFGNISWLFMEVIPFILLGVLGGFFGYYFIKVNSFFSRDNVRKLVRLNICRWFKLDDSWGRFAEIIAVLVVTSILNFPLEISRLPLNAYLKMLFIDCPKGDSSTSNSSNFMCQRSNVTITLKLIYIILQGFFLSSYTFGVDLPGGILMPSLVLGASTGRLVGILSQAFQNAFNWEYLATCTEKSCIVSPSSYAVIGAGAFMTGVTKLTLSVVVIMFEVTGAVTYVLPIMCAVMTLKFVSDWLLNDNIYDSWIKNFNNLYINGDPNEGKGSGLVNYSNLTTTVKNNLPDISIGAIMVPISKVKCVCLLPTEPYTTQSLLGYLNDDNHEGYPVILSYDDPISLGYICKRDLYTTLSTINEQVTISFQIENIPKLALSKQLHYEQFMRNKSVDLQQVELKVETSIIVTNDSSPMVLTLEEFEKLHLNYLIIMNHKHVMTGFVDRFILARLIALKFEDLQGEFGRGLADDLENNFEIDELLNMRGQRESIELIT